MIHSGKGVAVAARAASARSSELINCPRFRHLLLIGMARLDSVSRSSTDDLPAPELQAFCL